MSPIALYIISGTVGLTIDLALASRATRIHFVVDPIEARIAIWDLQTRFKQYSSWLPQSFQKASNELEAIRRTITDICELESLPDGLTFDPKSVRTVRIREDADYEGVRVQFRAALAGVRIPMQIDIGFGDVIVPGTVRIEYPTLLEFPPPVSQAYSKETVVAEKLEALTALGMLNSRMKDFFDLWALSRLYPFT